MVDNLMPRERKTTPEDWLIRLIALEASGQADALIICWCFQSDMGWVGLGGCAVGSGGSLSQTPRWTTGGCFQ